MKIILSRKGWDSGYGMRPSPVFGDSSIQSLPIECSPPSPAYSNLTPAAIRAQGFPCLGDFLASYHPTLGGSGIAHLDPDLEFGALTRAAGWLPCFGQDNSSMAASHLDRQGVGIGDLFLFYGWFDDVERHGKGWNRKGNDRHIIWGWLQVGSIVDPSAPTGIPAWLTYHPHVIHRSTYVRNRIYLSAPVLNVGDNAISGVPGAGLFGREIAARCITSQPGSRKLYPTAMPPWITPTRHRQEQVWDSNTEPKAVSWLRQLFL